MGVEFIGPGLIPARNGVLELSADIHHYQALPALGLDGKTFVTIRASGADFPDGYVGFVVIPSSALVTTVNLEGFAETSVRGDETFTAGATPTVLMVFKASQADALQWLPLNSQ